MSDYLIQVKAFRDKGVWSVTLLNYLDSKILIPSTLTPPMLVKPGDRVAWIVQVLIGNDYYPLPFEVRFFKPDQTTPNTSFFGAEKVAVAAGGTSPFLHVRSLQERIKYSIFVTGIGEILDPEMQTGDVSNIADPSTLSTAYAIQWDPGSKTLYYQFGTGALKELPPTLTVRLGDRIGFKTAPQHDFLATFINVPTRRWSSPFLQNSGTLPVGGPAPSIPPMVVADSVDPPGQPFQFSLATADGLHSSNVYAIDIG